MIKDKGRGWGTKSSQNAGIAIIGFTPTPLPPKLSQVPSFCPSFCLLLLLVASVFFLSLFICFSFSSDRSSSVYPGPLQYIPTARKCLEFWHLTQRLTFDTWELRPATDCMADSMTDLMADTMTDPLANWQIWYQCSFALLRCFNLILWFHWFLNIYFSLSCQHWYKPLLFF